MARNVPTEIILLEIANGLKTIISDGNLDKKISGLYALNEDEQKKFEDAQATIVQADQLKANLAAEAANYSDVSARLAKAEQQEGINNNSLTIIEDAKKDIEASRQKNEEDAKANENKATELSKYESDLDERDIELAKAKDEISELRTELQTRLNNIAAAAGVAA